MLPNAGGGPPLASAVHLLAVLVSVLTGPRKAPYSEPSGCHVVLAAVEELADEVRALSEERCRSVSPGAPDCPPPGPSTGTVDVPSSDGAPWLLVAAVGLLGVAVGGGVERCCRGRSGGVGVPAAASTPVRGRAPPRRGNGRLA